MDQPGLADRAALDVVRWHDESCRRDRCFFRILHGATGTLRQEYRRVAPQEPINLAVA